MRTIKPIIVTLIVLLQSTPLVAVTKPDGTALLLPDARAFQPYRAILEQVLTDKKLKLDSDSPSPAFRWSIDEGALPEGLRLDEKGVIWGVPQKPTEGPFEFSIKVADISMPGEDMLSIPFSILVKRSAIRLTNLPADQSSDVGPSDSQAAGQTPVGVRGKVVLASSTGPSPDPGNSRTNLSLSAKDPTPPTEKPGGAAPPAPMADVGECAAGAAGIAQLETKRRVTVDARSGVSTCFDDEGHPGSCLRYRKWD